MKPIKNNWLTVLVGFIFIIVIVWIFSQIQAQNQIDRLSQTAANNNQSISADNKTTQLTPQKSSNQPIDKCQYFYYAKVENNNVFLYRFCPISQANQLLYFDKDEKNKISSVLGISQNNQLIIWEQNNAKTVSQLVLVTTKPKLKKQILLKDFFSANPPSLSHNQEMIAFTSFSNAEQSFGFTLFVQNLDGSNKRKIIHTGGNILSPRFSWDNRKIAFIVNRGAQGSSILVYNLSNNQQINLFDSDKIITSLTWLNGKIIFTASPHGTATANQGEIFELNEDNSYHQLTKDKIYQGKLFSYDNGKHITYIQKQLASGVPEDSSTGVVKCLNCKLDFNKLNANYIFAWKEIK